MSGQEKLEQRIHERTRALRDSEARARAIAANLPGAAAFVVGHDLRYQFAGGEALEKAGVTEQSLLGLRLDEVLPPALVEQYEANYRRALAGQTFETEHESHGHVYLTRGVPLRNNQGEVYAALAVSYDITERRRAEAAVCESEAKLARELTDTRHLQRISSSLIVGDGVGALYQQVLDAARALMRSDMASIQRLSPERNELVLLAQQGFIPESAQFWDRVRADDTTSCGVAFARGEAVIVPDVEQWDLIAGTEDLRHCRLNSMRAMLSTPLLSREGHMVGVISTHWREVHEPTERELRLLEVLARQAADLIERHAGQESLRKSEERYRSLFETLDEGFCILEKIPTAPGEPSDFLYVAANPAFKRHTGLQDPIGKTILQLVPKAETSIMDRYDRVVETLLPDRFEAYVAALDLWMQAEVFPAQAPNQIAVLFSNVSERKRAEIALRNSEERHALLLRLSDALRAIDDEVQVQETAMCMLGEKLGLRRAYYFNVKRDGDSRVHIVRDAYQRETDAPTMIGRHPSEHFGEWMFEGFARGEVVAVADVSALATLTPAELASYRSLGVAAFLAVPLPRNGEYIGGIAAHHSSPHTWTEADITLIREVAARTWTEVERARAGAALRKSDARFRSLFISMNEGFAINQVVRDENGRVVDARYLEVNPAFEKQTGFALGSAVGRLASEIFPAFYLDWLQSVQRVLRTGQPERFERYVPDNGKWFVFYVTPFGGVDLFAVFCDDITQRKDAELVLRESQERQAYLLRLSDALRPLIDPAEIEGVAARLLGEALGVDRAYYVESDEATGISRVRQEYRRGPSPSLCGVHRIADFGWVIPPMRRGETIVMEDAASSALIPEPDRPAMAAVQIAAHVNVPLVKDGELVGALCVTESKPRRWEPSEITLVRETAERIWAGVERARAEAALLDSEERFRLLVDNVQEYALFQADMGGTVTSWNPGAERLFGYSSQEMLGQPVSLLFTPEDQEAGVLGRELRAAQGGKRSEDTRFVVCKLGRRFWAQWVTEPVFDGGGQLRGVVKVLRDETERKRAEEQQILLMGELNHRVKNTLATVQSLASQTLRTAANPESFVSCFKGRVQALSSAHNLLTRLSWEAAEVGDILRDQLLSDGDADRLSCSGPQARVDAQSALALALVLHELGTNARKYGALSVPDGKLTVIWEIAGDTGAPHLNLEWVERGGPLVHKPEKAGFGAALIAHSLKGVSGNTELRFDPEGLSCSIRLPLVSAESGGRER